VATRDSLSKTVPVQVSYTKVHPLYKKRTVVSKKILVHTEREILRGQKVAIEESRKVSKNKAWKVISVQEEETQG
jgi:ribosomal protein S17